MSRIPEASSVFAAVASNVLSQDLTPMSDVDLSISELNRSLNLSEAPGFRILDTALSLMGFTAPQVCDSMIECTLKTLVTVLSSSAECKVLRIDKEQVLRVGGTISKSDCANVIKCCADIIGRLDGHKGDLCASLLYTVIRVAALAPCFHRAMPSTSVIEMKFSDSRASAVANLLGHFSNELKSQNVEVPLSDSRASAVANLLGHFPNEFKSQNVEVPLRLLLWHIDPMILKQDILQILQETIRRPLLSFSIEVYDRIEWRSKFICLVISPLLFIEARSLLHNWFLMTGLASVMELQIDFVQQMLDVISRPMWWGLSKEIGSKLPFSHAYFPHEHHLLRILAGPISEDYLQHLLNKISGSVSDAGGHLHMPSKKAAAKINVVDHRSMWALVMNFPGWFYFASMLLFCGNSPTDGFHSGSRPWSAKSHLIHDAEVFCSTGAANFIAWILNPICEFSKQLMVDYLVKISELWILERFSSSKCKEVTSTQVKETWRPRLHHDKDGKCYDEENSQTIWCWLREFKDMYVKLFRTKVTSSAFSTKELNIHQTLLVRRIPLGILLEYPNRLDAAGYSFILHYAATGTIHKLTLNSGQSQKSWKYDWQDSVTWVEQYTKVEAIAGCKTVFDITDIAESISPSITETEEEGLNFICQLKLKTCDYLLTCIKRLLQIKLDGYGVLTQRDLLTRVIRWRHQGQDVFQNNKDLDYICDALIV